TRLLGVGLQPHGSSPHREKPRQRGCNPPARVEGDPPSTAGLNRGGKGPSTGLQRPGGEATGSENRRKISFPIKSIGTSTSIPTNCANLFVTVDWDGGKGYPRETRRPT